MTNNPDMQLTLAQCPIGLFMAGDELCLKTEYGNNEGRIDAYIVSSGEFFWGSHPQTIANQRMQMVEPVDADALLAHRSQETVRSADVGRETQVLVRDTIAGPRDIEAPAGWKFDKTAIIAWAKLVHLTREARKPQKRQRDAYVLNGQIDELSILLANALGMARLYWKNEATACAAREDAK